jgi:hypothetical protein
MLRFSEKPLYAVLRALGCRSATKTPDIDSVTLETICLIKQGKFAVSGCSPVVKVFTSSWERKSHRCIFPGHRLFSSLTCFLPVVSDKLRSEALPMSGPAGTGTGTSNRNPAGLSHVRRALGRRSGRTKPATGKNLASACCNSVTENGIPTVFPW